METNKVLIDPKAFHDFERIFLAWLDRNQYEVEAAGSGNVRELAALCAQWQARHFLPEVRGELLKVLELWNRDFEGEEQILDRLLGVMDSAFPPATEPKSG